LPPDLVETPGEATVSNPLRNRSRKRLEASVEKFAQNNMAAWVLAGSSHEKSSLGCVNFLMFFDPKAISK
jgi:hypothetical protein